MKTKILDNKAAASLIVTLLIFLVVANAMKGVVRKTHVSLQKQEQVVSREVVLQDRYVEVELDPNSWILVKNPFFMYRYSCPAGTRIRYNGQEIINSPDREDSIGRIFFVRGNGKIIFERVD